MRRFIATFVSILVPVSSCLGAASKAELPPRVVDFLDLNCYECHNSVDKKGELDLESLVFDPTDHSSMNLWAFVHDRIHHEEMPPKEDSLVEPDERSEFLSLFEPILHDESAARIQERGRVRSRRMNRIEYENTIHELLGIKVPVRELLPEDQAEEGFTNIAESQQVSYHLLEKYLKIVDVSLDEAFQRALSPESGERTESWADLQMTEIVSEVPPIFSFEGRLIYLTNEEKTYRYEGDRFVDTGFTLGLQETIAKNEAIAKKLATGPYKRMYNPRELGVGTERTDNERQGLRHDGQVLSFPTTHGFHGRMAGTTIPETGWYRIRVKAKSHNPPEGRNVWGRVYTGILRAKAPVTYWVGKFEATRELQEYTFDAWILKDHIIGVQPIDKTIKWVSSKAIADQSVLEMDDISAVAVESLEVERIQPGLTQSEIRQRLFGNLELKEGEVLSERPQEDLKRLMSGFAEQAFRRPASASELRPYFRFASQELAHTGSLLKAIHAGYRAILSSHRFLYFQEEPGRLDDYSIASRLSYFLWSTQPDKTLLDLAKAGRLSEPRTLTAQVERMLQDPKSEAFVNNFTDSWLNLRDISFTTPDANLYPEFDNILLHSMLDETHAFLREMIREDLSVANIIDSDFAMLNERLAKHYGIEGFQGTGIQKVTLDAESRRGGVLTHASVLKVTANGTTSSPIIRGVWMLERIMGKHIPPPPDQVPAVEPDIRGAVSIRDQLDKHRSTESCMACHRIIDPPGFALENYDVIGGWRDHYRAIGEEKKKWTNGPVVDASYELPNGQSFRDIEGFKEIMLSDSEQVARNLFNQVLTYATGAGIEFADRREIDEMVKELAAHDYGFRSMIHAVAQSDIFLSK